MKPVFTILSIIITLSSMAQDFMAETYSKKVSPALKRALITKIDHKKLDDYLLVVRSIADFKQSIRNNKISCSIIAENDTYNVVTISASRYDVANTFLPLPEILFVGFYARGKEEVKVPHFDQAVNKINYIHNKYPDTDGKGFHVSIKENMFDTADLDLAGRYFPTPVVSNMVTYHASAIATIIGGAGNSSVWGAGVAPLVKLSSSSFGSLLPDNDAIFMNNSIFVQNHSYGTITESYYGPEAKAYDVQTSKLPQLLHIFSSGNSGDQNGGEGPYKGIPGYANLTGNFKSAKNALVVGATDAFNAVLPLSSRGPAFDGRVKPEVVAYGADGSSTASAIVSGIAVLLQHSYKKLYGIIPSASLLKAVLINGADDTGVPGIDFATGFGAVNAKSAVEHILKNTCFEDTVRMGNQKIFSITIPSNTKRLKVTLVWNESAAEINTTKALLDDLDLRLTNTTTAQTYLPWVLNHAAHTDSLQKPAERKKDSLNNVEQITIDQPVAGIYAVHVSGLGLKSPAQPFSVAYQVQTTDEFDFIFPLRNDNLVSGANSIIRWQTNISGKGILQFSLDNGTSWQTMDSSVELSKQFYNWHTPDVFHTAQIRLVDHTQLFTSDTFTISRPVTVNTGFDCFDNFMLSWNAIPNISGYRIYHINNQHLEELGSTSDTVSIYNKKNQPSWYYSVAPVLAPGKLGVRSDTYNYTSQHIHCYIHSFYAITDQDNALLSLELGTLTGISKLYIQKWKSSRYVDIAQIQYNTSLKYSFTDSMITAGINNYRIKTVLSSGEVLYSDPTSVYSFRQSGVIVYPNPVAKGKSFLVVSSQNNDQVHFLLFNAVGMLVSQHTLQNSFTLIETGSLPKGIYYYSVKSKNAILGSGKVIVY